jgi:thiol-disulfide isomerase/thioredoxin
MLVFAGLSCGLLAGQAPPIYQANAGAMPQSIMPPQDRQSLSLQQNNIFLEYYSKQGVEFSASIFVKSGNGLVKKNINYDDMKKTIVVFFGNWCPHCDQFITEFSKHIEKLKQNGINVIFLNIPSVDRLKDWKDPSMEEFLSAEAKIKSHGINLSKEASVVLLGDRATLAKAGVEGLPTILVLKNGKEQFRGIGQAGAAKMNFSDPFVFEQFLAIWKEDDKSDDTDKSQESSKPKKSVGRKKGIKQQKQHSLKRQSYETKRRSSVNLIEARNATKQLNKFDRQIVCKKHAAEKRRQKRPRKGGCTCSKLS